MVTNGKTSLIENINSSIDGKHFVYGHVIAAGTTGFYQSADFPLPLGWSEELRDDLSKHIRMILDGTTGTQVEFIDTSARLDNLRVIHLVLRFPNGLVHYWVDVERGAIPVLRHDEMKGGQAFDLALDDIRHVEKHGWLPFVKTVFATGGRAQRLTIQSVNFDSPPNPAVFRFQTETPIGMLNKLEGVSYKPQKVWNLDDLPSRTSSGVARLAKSPSISESQRRLPGERVAGFPLFTFLGLIIALMIGLLLFLRRFRK